MEDERRKLSMFIQFHAHRPELDQDRRCAHLARPDADGCVPMDVKIEKMGVEELKEALNLGSEATPPVLFLMNQLKTYDPEKEMIMGLIFSRDCALASVVRRGPARSDCR